MPEERPEAPYSQPGNPLDGPEPEAEDDQADVGEATGEGADPQESADSS